MNSKKGYIVLLLIVATWFLFPMVADAQCAMCNATASTGNEGKNESALALNNGILFLMAIPYLLLSAIVVIMLVYRKQRRAERGEMAN